MGMYIWDSFPCDHYLSLVPWTRLDLESEGTPRPVPFIIAGVAPEVLASLHEAHQLLRYSVLYRIYDMVSGRSSLGDPVLRVRVEDAYAEVVQSLPHLREHIRCGREPDGTFQWEFPLDPTQSGIPTFAGVRVMNGLTKQEA